MPHVIPPPPPPTHLYMSMSCMQARNTLQVHQPLMPVLPYAYQQTSSEGHSSSTCCLQSSQAYCRELQAGVHGNTNGKHYVYGISQSCEELTLYL